MNVNNQLPAPLTPGNSSNEKMDWEAATKRNRRKQRKDEKKNAGKTKAKPDAILIRKKDPNATFDSVLKLMKNKVDKEQVAENINKIRQTKTGGDVLVQGYQREAPKRSSYKSDCCRPPQCCFDIFATFPLRGN